MKFHSIIHGIVQAQKAKRKNLLKKVLLVSLLLKKRMQIRERIFLSKSYLIAPQYAERHTLYKYGSDAALVNTKCF